MTSAKAQSAPEQKPRCRNCRYWRVYSEGGTFGLCLEPGGRVVLDMPTVRAVEQVRLTTDLTVCSAWVPKD